MFTTSNQLVYTHLSHLISFAYPNKLLFICNSVADTLLRPPRGGMFEAHLNLCHWSNSITNLWYIALRAGMSLTCPLVPRFMSFHLLAPGVIPIEMPFNNVFFISVTLTYECDHHVLALDLHTIFLVHASICLPKLLLTLTLTHTNVQKMGPCTWEPKFSLLIELHHYCTKRPQE